MLSAHFQTPGCRLPDRKEYCVASYAPRLGTFEVRAATCVTTEDYVASPSNTLSMRRLLALLLVAVLGAALWPATSQAEGARVLADRVAPGAGWEAWRLASGGSNVTVRFEQNSSPHWEADFLFVIDGAGRLVVGLGQFGGGSFGPDLVIRRAGAPDVTFRHQVIQGEDGKWFTATTFDRLSDGWTLVAAWAAAPDRPFAPRVSLTASAPASLAARAQGDRVALLHTRDFQAESLVFGNVAGMDISAVRGGRFGWDVTNGAWGFFLGGNPATTRIGYTGPSASDAGQFTYAFIGDPPGNYTFTVEQLPTVSSPLGAADVMLLVADVALP